VTTRPSRLDAALLTIGFLSTITACAVPGPSPATSAPATSAPLTSAPATSAPATADDPTGVTWRLVTMGGGPVPPQPQIDLLLAGGRASGHGGCNSFGGDYVLAGPILRFDRLASTAMGCLPAEIVDREDAYVSALSATRSWAIDAGHLSLFDDRSAVRLVFEPAG
jgi:heat shock protein HslJ